MLRTLFSVLMIALLSGAALAQGALYPDTPAGRAAERWFAAVRSGDPDTLHDLIENHFDADFRDRVGVDQHLARHTALAGAGLNAPHSVARASDHDITLYLRDGGVWGELRISVNTDPPHGITNVGVRPSNGPAEARGRPEATRVFQEEMAEFLGALHKNHSLQIEVVVVRGGLVDSAFQWTSGEAQEIPIQQLAFLKRIAGVRLIEIGYETVDIVASSADSNLVLPKIPDPDTEALANRLDESLTNFFIGPYWDLEPKPIQHTGCLVDPMPGLLYQLICRPLAISDNPIHHFTTLQLAKIGYGVLDQEFLASDLARALTVGPNSDLDPSPTITRRTALGFEERIDHTPEGDIRSFSASAGDETQHTLLRCYPGADYVVVIVAQDGKTLNLIDRRIFNRLPGLEPTP